MKIRELVQRVQSNYSKGVHSDDTRLRPRHIYSTALSVRSVLIEQKVNKNKEISQWMYQNLECVEMINSPLSDCPCVPPTGCVFLRSKQKLPEPITGLQNTMIASVTSISGYKFDKTTFEDFEYEENRKYSSKKLKYFIKNQYLYILAKNYPEVVTVRGMFNDPLAYKNFTSCGCEEDEISENCESILDSEFTIDAELLEYLIENVSSKLVDEFNTRKEDQTNNSMDNNLNQNESK